MAKTSPGSGSRSIMAATASGIAPRWTGMCSAWATMLPSASKSAVEQSRLSLIFEEQEPRIRTAPISSAIPARALARTESVTGSSLPIVFFQHERAYTIYHTPPRWPYDASGLPELDYGRTLYLGTLAHLLAVEHRHRDPLPVEVGLPLSCNADGVLGLGLRELWLLYGDRGDEAQVHELDVLVIHAVAVALLVRCMETLFQLLEGVCLDGQLEGLTPVAQVSPSRVLGVGELLIRRALHLREPSLELICVHLLERGEVRVYVVAADIRDGETEGGEDAAGPRDEDGPHAKLLREGAGVHTAGPAEGE